MFTGIVEELGRVKAIETQADALEAFYQSLLGMATPSLPAYPLEVMNNVEV